jgi:DNA-binding NarL/FixJ family response regulator
MDVEMPAIDGIAATKQIIEQSPGTKVIIFTAHPQPDLLALALRAGATGYVLKSSSAAELHEAVHTVAGGGTFVNGGFDAPSPGVSNLEALSPREVEILQLLAEGKRAKDIANELSLSPATVHTHVRNAISKLEVDTRTQAVALAVRFRYLVDAPELEELDEGTQVGGDGAVLPNS